MRQICVKLTLFRCFIAVLREECNHHFYSEAMERQYRQDDENPFEVSFAPTFLCTTHLCLLKTVSVIPALIPSHVQSLLSTKKMVYV